MTVSDLLLSLMTREWQKQFTLFHERIALLLPKNERFARKPMSKFPTLTTVGQNVSPCSPEGWVKWSMIIWCGVQEYQKRGWPGGRITDSSPTGPIWHTPGSPHCIRYNSSGGSGGLHFIRYNLSRVSGSSHFIRYNSSRGSGHSWAQLT